MKDSVKEQFVVKISVTAHTEKDAKKIAQKFFNEYDRADFVLGLNDISIDDKLLNIKELHNNMNSLD